MITIPDYSELFLADGAPGGVVSVVDSSKFWPSSRGSVEATGLSGMEIMVLQLIDSTHIKIKEIDPFGPPRAVVYSGANLTAYTVALGARITIPQQQLFYQNGGGVVDRIPTIL
jgi:hypothetical protein